jgi:hypothetical protein
MQFHRARTFFVSAVVATTALLASVATVLAGGGPGPFPK